MEITIAQLVITTRTTVDIAVCLPPPTAPIIIGVSSKGSPNMAARTNTVLFQAPPPSNVTSRVATIVVTPVGTTTANPPIVLDYVANPAASFTANDGDTYSITAVDSDSAGPSPGQNAFTGTITAPVSPPIDPVITGVSSV